MGVGLITMTAYPGIWSVQDYQEDFNPSILNKAGRPPQILKKADPSQFGSWIQAQPLPTQKLFTPCKRDSRWGKVRRTYNQVIFYDKNRIEVAKEDPEGSKKVKKQKYIVCLDPNSPFAGNVYSNDDKMLIYIKFLASLYMRPVHTVLYTVYNVTLIHAAVIIFNGIKDQKPASETLQKVVCSLADIVRTPVYGVAILIVTVAGLLSAPFHPELVYDFRAVIARLNRELGWGKKEGEHDFMPCMQPKINIMEYTLNDQEIKEDNAYEDETNPVLVALDNKRCLKKEQVPLQD